MLDIASRRLDLRVAVEVTGLWMLLAMVMVSWGIYHHHVSVPLLSKHVLYYTSYPSLPSIFPAAVVAGDGSHCLPSYEATANSKVAKWANHSHYSFLRYWGAPYG